MKRAQFAPAQRHALAQDAKVDAYPSRLFRLLSGQKLHLAAHRPATLHARKGAANATMQRNPNTLLENAAKTDSSETTTRKTHTQS
eukprot:2931250-Amphidinium_carterae.1